MLHANNVSVRIPTERNETREIVSGVSLQLESGRMYALAGASGSGKTTLLHLMAGILVPTIGEVHARGELLSGLSESERDRWRRRNCGMVFQDFRLLDELGVLSNTLLPTWFGDLPKRDYPRRAATLLAGLGVPLGKVSVSRLSRGEQQRVALARALINDPDIILADEPTASLDVDNASDLVERLVMLVNQGKLVVCATHDTRLIDRAAQVFRLQNGRLV